MFLGMPIIPGVSIPDWGRLQTIRRKRNTKNSQVKMMKQISIFDFIEDVEKKPRKNRRRKRKEMIKKILEFQGENYFDAQDAKLVEELEKAFEQEIYAYKHEMFDKIRVILKDYDFFTQGVFDIDRKTTYVFPSERLTGRKSIWMMASDRWVWRDSETLRKVIDYIEHYVLDDSNDKPWSWVVGADIFSDRYQLV